MLATWGTSTGRNPTLDLQFAGATSLDDRITFSRGSQATLFDSTGALVYAKHNLALQSENLSTTWTPTGATVSANATTSPSGTTTADKLQEDTSTGSHLVSQNITFIAASHTASVFAKKAERDFVRVLMFDGTNTFSGFFNLSNGTIGTLTGTGTTATIADFGNGWYRCAITATTAAGSGSFAPRIALADNNSSYTGVAGNGIFMWGAQLNLTPMEGGVTSSLSTYYPTVASAYYAPRFDYNPDTLAAQGLLIEEQRTNSIRNNTMQGAVAGTPGTDPTNWVVSGAGGAITSKTIVGFGTDGGIAYVDIRFVFNAGGTATIRPEQTTQIAASSGQTWTGSSYVKLAGGSLANCTVNKIVQYRAAGVGVTNQIVAFVPTTAELRIQRETISFAATDPTTTTVNFDIQVVTSGAADFTLRIGLPQLEQGAFATSVIPTTTTALTRNADVASMTGTDFSSWYNAAAGSLLVQFSIPAQSSATSLATIGDGTANERMIVNAATNRAGTGWRVVDGGVDQCDINITSSFSAGQSVKTIGAYAVNDFAVCQNGGTVGTDVSGTLPTVNALYIGTNGAAAYTNSYIQRISYYPVRLPNSTLQALTA